MTNIIAGKSPAAGGTVSLRLIRNATLILSYAGCIFLVDPMLAAKGSYPGFPNAYSERRNPLVDLPIPAAELLSDIDAVLLTHTHLDHWDDAAQKLLPKTLPIFVQNAADAALVGAQGFHNIQIIGETTRFKGISLHKTAGQHGTAAMYADPDTAARLGKTMGIVLQAEGHKSVYIAGDTIWYPGVEAALAQYRPEIIILNAGYACITAFAGSVIMGKEDILRVHQAMPTAKIIAVHMEAVNHAMLSRAELRHYIAANRLGEQVMVPADGEELNL
ncbi:MBL fold metallo-hydrolase [Candidatus Tokpelaia sp.]|uniref:MBL fold metallo-hydrolase n=1 Tax=Candidatus Tokpelaia sp. TaxID=2233777 RepID=UPI001238FA49|nr:MBL fold metallo-hydrolase [Candidatus Tokpelaia sp.]KAA6406118.1 MBL fold metallo-hydrolase [Candidatus Tokpelaia sp.]